ncbi:MAG: DUF1580 domain-containing protein [Planctomycetota bacterium]
MIDTTKEHWIPIRQVPAELEQRGLGKRVHLAAVYPWVHHGLGGARLESMRIGGTTVTSVESSGGPPRTSSTARRTTPPPRRRSRPTWNAGAPRPTGGCRSTG